mgnify:CR=1 FL=1
MSVLEKITLIVIILVGVHGYISKGWQGAIKEMSISIVSIALIAAGIIFLCYLST